MSRPRPGRPSLALLPVHSADVPLATSLAQRLQLPLAPEATDPRSCQEFDLLMMVSDGTLSLQQTLGGITGGPGERRERAGRKASGGALPGPVRVDFGSPEMRHRRRSGQNELLGRAVGVAGRRRPPVLDATAGLGRDSFVLADMGCEVTLCEKEPVVVALLEQGLQAARLGGDPWLQQVVRRMSLAAGDARSLAAQQLDTVDVIYLDPMFPQRQKSAAVKKEMALFQLLLGGAADTELDADQLLHWAVDQDVARVVVKRAVRTAFLGRRKPSHSVTGKAVRFDVYVLRSID